MTSYHPETLERSFLPPMTPALATGSPRAGFKLRKSATVQDKSPTAQGAQELGNRALAAEPVSTLKRSEPDNLAEVAASRPEVMTKPGAKTVS